MDAGLAFNGKAEQIFYFSIANNTIKKSNGVL